MRTTRPHCQRLCAIINHAAQRTHLPLPLMWRTCRTSEGARMGRVQQIQNHPHGGADGYGMRHLWAPRALHPTMPKPVRYKAWRGNVVTKNASVAGERRMVSWNGFSIVAYTEQPKYRTEHVCLCCGRYHCPPNHTQPDPTFATPMEGCCQPEHQLH